MSIFYRSRVVVGVSALAVTLSACAGAGGEPTSDSMAEMAPVELSFHYLSTQGSHQGQGMEAMAKYVEEESDGKITIKGYPAGSLLKAGEELEGVSSGVADMGLVIGSLEAEELPILNWVDAMNSIAPSSMPHGLLELSVAMNLVQAQSDVIQEEWKSHGVVPLTANVSDVGYGLQCTKPLASPEDAKGVTARAGTPIHNTEVAAMGLEPVNLPITEAYEALQRNAVDCIVGAATTMRDFGFWEVAPYFVPVTMSTITSVNLVVNEASWNRLPTDAQELMQRAALVFMESSLTTTLNNYKAYAEDGPTEHGVEVIDPRPLDEVLNASQEKAIQELMANPPAGVADPEALRRLFEDALARGAEVAEASTASPTEEGRDVDTIMAGFLAGSEAVDMDTYFRMMKEALGVE